MTKTSFLLILSTVAVLAAASCKKDKDNKPPEVALYSPASDAKFNVGDTIAVSGHVSDENQLGNVTVGLVDNQNMPLSANVSVGTGSNNFDFSATIIVSNIQLLSGRYYIRLQASDGVSTSEDYKRIYLTAIPRKRTGIYLVTATNDNSTHVAYVDNANNAVQMLTLSGDYLAATISTMYKQLYVCGKYSGGVNAINLEGKNIAWNIPASISAFPFFGGMNYAEGVSYISYCGGNIYGFDNTQARKYTATAKVGYYPMHSFRHNGYLLVEHHQVNGNAEKLVKYQAYGTALEEASLDAKLVQMFGKDQYNVILFGNNTTQGVIKRYDSQHNVMYPLNTCDSINDAIQLDENRYVLALTTGVYIYNYSNNNVTTFVPGINASSIAYDDVNNEYMISTGVSLKIYDGAGSGLKYSVTASEPIKKALLLFNK